MKSVKTPAPLLFGVAFLFLAASALDFASVQSLSGVRTLKVAPSALETTSPEVPSQATPRKLVITTTATCIDSCKNGKKVRGCICKSKISGKKSKSSKRNAAQKSSSQGQTEAIPPIKEVV